MVTHEHDGKKAQNVGFLGRKGSSLRTLSEIPSQFRREENGTDIFILGYESGSSWVEDLKFSVLENFWPAILMKRLVVQIEDEKIDHKSLARFMEEFSKKPDFYAYYYYSAATSSDKKMRSTTFRTLGEVSVCLLEGDVRFPKRIAMVRSTGMIIFKKQFRSIVNFAGFFYCGNSKGNIKLREMEPPTHDNWIKIGRMKGQISKCLLTWRAVSFINNLTIKRLVIVMEKIGNRHKNYEVLNLIGYGLSKFNDSFIREFGFITKTAFYNYFVQLGVAETASTLKK